MRFFLLVPALLLAACGGGGGGGGGGAGGQVAIHYDEADFQRVQDFLANPLVQEMLRRANIQVHTGSTPPLLEGVYEAAQRIFLNDVPPRTTGPVPSFTVTILGQTADRITVDDEGTDTTSEGFLTGSGDDFTIWFVVSGDLSGGGFDCVVVEVDILSGSVLPNGDIELRYGAVLVGWFGRDCDAVANALGRGSADAALGLVIAATTDLTLTGPVP